jgi:cobalt-zinc-cadmium resistance protein CzcA
MGPIATGLGEIYQYTLEVEPEFKNQYSVTERTKMGNKRSFQE